MQHLPQRVDLVLGQAHAQHLHVVPRPAALRRPAGHAAIQLLHDVAGQLRVVLLGEDQQLHRHVLPVQPVQEQIAQHVVHSGVDGGGGVEQEEAQGIQPRVEGDGEPPHGEAAAAFAQIQPQNVQPAGGAAAAEHQTAGKAHQNTAHHAAGEQIRYHRRGGGGDDRQKQGVGGGADGRLPEKRPPQCPERQQEQRHVHEEIQNTCQIEGQIQCERPLQQGTHHLTQTVGSAAV